MARMMGMQELDCTASVYYNAHVHLLRLQDSFVLNSLAKLRDKGMAVKAESERWNN